MSDAANFPVDVGLQAGSAKFGFQLVGFQQSEVGLSPVREDHLHLFYMVQGLAVDHRVGAAGVVANASADAGTVGCGGIGGVLQTVDRQLPVELVQDDSRLDPDPHFLGVDFDNLVQILAEVDDDGMVHGLPGQAGASGAGQDWNVVLLGYFHHCQHVVHGPGDHHPHRLHLVDAGVGAVEDPGIGVEAHLSGNPGSKGLSQVFALFTANTGCRRGAGGHSSSAR